VQWRHLAIPARPAEVEDWWALVPPLSSPERALMGAAAGMLAQGEFWTLLVAAISTLDRWWLGITQADGNKAVGSLHIFNGGCPIVRSAGGRAEGKTPNLEAAILSILTNPKKLSPGVHLIIAKLAPWLSPAVQAHFPQWFASCWGSRLWHVRCEAARVARYVVRDLSESIKSELIPIFERIWKDTKVVVGPEHDVLAVLVELGVVEDPSFDYEHAANVELEDALVSVETAEACREAYFAFERQFEEFIGDAYCRAIMSLNYDQRVILLCRAAKGALGADELAEPSTILQELVASEDARAIDALVGWAQVPLKRTFMSNEGYQAFILANAGLGRLRHPNYNIGIRPESVEDRIWYDIGTIIRHLHVQNPELTAPIFEQAWANLQQEEPWQVLESLMQTFDTRLDTRSNFQLVDPSSHFPQEVRRVILKALSLGISESLRKNHRTCRGPHLDPISYAFYILERVGTESDAKVLDRFVDDADWGRDAIDAVITIRNRESLR